LGGIVGWPVRRRCPEIGDDPAPHGFRLRVNRREQVAQRSSQAVHLVD
jgi:hypothetical protein